MVYIDINKTLHLDTETQYKKDTITAVILSPTHISTVWFTRANNSQLQPFRY